MIFGVLRSISVGVMMAGLVTGCVSLPSAGPVLEVDDPIWNLPRITSGSEQKRTLTVRNAGDAPLVIEKVEQCCGFNGFLDKNTLLPGESTPLQLRFRQAQTIGDINAEIILVSNDRKRPRFPVTALGNSVPRIQACGELVSSFIDLGILHPGEVVPFEVRVRSTGNEGLRLMQIEKSRNVYEVQTEAAIASGEEKVLRFRFIANQIGPIEESVTFSTNDPLQETLPFRLKGYVARDWVPDRALVIYPVGQIVQYHPVLGSYRYDLVVENRGEAKVDLVSIESSLPVQLGTVQKAIDPKSKGGAEISFGLSLRDPKPVTGTVSLQLLLPVEIR